MVDNSGFGGPTAAQAAAGNAAAGVKTAPIATYQDPSLVNTPGTPQYNPSGFATPQPAKEPTVVSGSTITDSVIPGLVKSAAAVSQKGTYIGQNGNTYYSDGSAVPAPLDAEYDPTTKTYSSGGQSYLAPPEYVDNPTNDPDIAQTNNLFAGLKQSLDTSTLTQVNSIEKQYTALQGLQADANARADSARTTLNANAGTARFAPLDAAGTALAQTSYGLQQIQKLDADEDSAIATVKKAQSDGDYQLMESALTQVNSIRTAKTAAAQKLSDTLSAANDAALKQKAQATQDSAIAGLVSQGTTNPADILKAMNDAGYNVSATDVAASLKALTPTSTATDTYKFTTANVGSLLGAGLNAKQIQAVQDYYNGKGDAGAFDGMTDAQKAAVQTALVGKTAAAKATAGAKSYTSGTLDYTHADLDEGNAKLQASKGADGYVDPTVYLNLANAWTDAGGSINDFIKNYPVSSWVNPANTDVTPAINALIKQDAAGKKTTAGASASDLSSEINNLFTTQ